MVLSSLITLMFAEVIKPYISAVLSVVMALTSVLTGPCGEYAKLSVKTYSESSVHSHIDYDISVNVGEISALSGVDDIAAQIPGVYEDGILNVKNGFDVYADLDNVRFALTTEKGEKQYGVYLDSAAFAVSPDLTRDIMELGDDSYAAAYSKYLDGKTIFVSFDEFAGNISGVSGSHDADTMKQLYKVFFEDIGKTMTTEENIKLLGDFIVPMLEGAEKLYSEKELDGVKTYTFRADGKQLVQYCKDVFEKSLSEKSIDTMLTYAKTIALSLDYSKYAQVIGVDISDMIIPTSDELDETLAEVKAELLKSTAAILPQISVICDILISGEGVEILGEFAPVYNYLANSYIESSIYEKDGRIYENREIVITNGEKQFAKLCANAVTEKYDGEVPAASELYTAEQKLDFDVLESKVIFEKAASDGVNSVEISWISEMKPGDAAPLLGEVYFEVYYNSLQEEFASYAGYQTDPTLTDVDRARIQDLFDSKVVFEKKDFDSSAYLIDGSAMRNLFILQMLIMISASPAM